MKGKDEIKDLFEQKLSGYEANVRPELWTNISSQIAGVPAGTGMSLFTKIAIGFTAAASAGIIGFYITRDTDSSDRTIEQKDVPTVSQNGNTEVEQDVNTSSTGQQNESSVEENAVITDNVQQLELPGDDRIHNNNEVGTVSHDEPGATIDPIEPKKSVASNEKPTVNKDNTAAEEDKTESEPVMEDKTESGTLGELFNIFTPNGDGANDVLYLESENISDFSIVVIDQQNKIVYQSTDPSFRWDGTGLNGDPVPSGKYVYYVTARNSAGKVLSKHSVLQISR